MTRVPEGAGAQEERGVRADRAADSAPAGLDDVLWRDVRDVLASEAAIASEDIRPEMPLDALGLDSVKMTQVIFALEDAFGIDFPLELDASGSTPRTAGELARLVGRLRAEAG